MTVDEAKAHFQKLAQEAGLSAAEQKAVLQAMENEKFRTGVSAGYKRHDEFSREMDAVRAEKQKLQDWYEKEELPKYNLYNSSLDTLRKYEERYGRLEDPQGLNNGGNGNGNGRGAGFSTKEEVDRYIEDKLRQRDSAYVGLTKSTMKLMSDHMKRFGVPMDPDDVDKIEKLALDKGLALDQAYKEFIAPREQAAVEERHKKEIEAAKEQAIRDYQSRHNLPVDSQPREHHPFFDRKSPAKDASDLDQDRASRDAFSAAWNEYEQGMQKTGQ